MESGRTALIDHGGQDEGCGCRAIDRISRGAVTCCDFGEAGLRADEGAGLWQSFTSSVALELAVVLRGQGSGEDDGTGGAVLGLTFTGSGGLKIQPDMQRG